MPLLRPALLLLFVALLAPAQRLTPVDGSKTPALIPDCEAFSALFLLLSDGQDCSPSTGFCGGFLSTSGLQLEEKVRLIDFARLFRGATNTCKEKVQKLKQDFNEKSLTRAAYEKALLAAWKEQDAATAHLIADFKQQLAPSSLAALDAFLLRKVKPTISTAIVKP